ncbi:acyltransferase [Kytococcus sedentarius]|uniref:Acetyltransferase (Isoleucine patch superfamily) n=1 Tax=Kytococcus sedentarius (strain ATCC 14392 / DSM 20547 / JCM 11482 / CCUG 33030 / NBRC 15357 / NCTC 11040 / CCM 314 / 541) TaxID=478801 RepID=C7NJT9_KYTSD|nr:DapH/DapD/GlmU-related protein [Kytococcus sedentarius]ACV06871.1 acetyltransferase (isoleucine patch superfamily) [Kytococcus sedentarius DSM 20547]QQB62889.1 acyltransferase [Kytococcus sedentarius]STX14304.1 Galactoside O-acetyltransferase [Kytococcus sedentarius]
MVSLKSLARRSAWVVPEAAAEFPARGGGWLVGILQPHHAQGVEGLVRGAFWGRRVGARGLSVGRNCILDGANLHIGRDVRIHAGAQIITGRTGHVTIGAHSHVARQTVISGLGGVTLGEHCAIGPAVTIFSSTTDLAGRPLGTVPAKRKPVVIGNEVYVGAGARISPGVTIGDGAVIGAGAVVVSDVPAWHIAKGVPARSTPRTDVTLPEGM